MCYICGNLGQTSQKHLKMVAASLDDAELNHVLEKTKAQMRTLEKLPETDIVSTAELRYLILVLIGEKLSRLRA